MISLYMTNEQYEIIRAALKKADEFMAVCHPYKERISYINMLDEITRHEIDECNYHLDQALD